MMPGYHSPRRLIYFLAAAAVLLACGNPITRLVAEPTPTFTPTFTRTPRPPDTATFTPSPSPTTTPTATATPTPTDMPVPTATVTPELPTPVPATPTPAEPAAPAPIPEPPTLTPAPEVATDFRIASWRLWPLALNSGCAKGMHVIFIHVLDVNGSPLDGIVVGDSWNNVEVTSGNKGPGRTEIDLWTNTMELLVKRNAATGESYTSEVSFPFSSFMTTIPNEQMVQAGYCANDLECDWKREHDSYYCGGHYSWEVIFQKTH